MALEKLKMLRLTAGLKVKAAFADEQECSIDYTVYQARSPNTRRAYFPLQNSCGLKRLIAEEAKRSPQGKLYHVSNLVPAPWFSHQTF